MQQIFDELKAFILRGNVIDLAIAVVVGGAFGLVVASLTADIIMPILAAIFGKPDFNDIGFNLGDSRVGVGSFITAIVNFLIVAAAIFFFVVKPMNWLLARRKKEEAEGVAEPPEDVALLREIRDLLARQRGQ